MSVTGGVTQLDELHLTTDLADSYIASAVTWNGKQAALVSGTNIKTINGSSVLGSGDLVVGGSSSLAIGTTPITSGTIGRVLFQGTGDVLQQSADLFWDNTNDRLGIGTSTPSSIIHSVGSVTASSAIARGIYFNNTLGASANNDVLVALDLSTTFNNNGFSGINSIYIRELASSGFNTPSNVFAKTEIQGAISDWNSSGGGILQLRATGSLAKGIRIGRTSAVAWIQGVEDNVTSNVPFSINAGGGNVLIGTATDAGFKLDVNGTARVQNLLQVSQTITAQGSANLPTSGSGVYLYYNNNGGNIAATSNFASPTPTQLCIQPSGSKVALGTGGEAFANTNNNFRQRGGAEFALNGTTQSFDFYVNQTSGNVSLNLIRPSNTVGHGLLYRLQARDSANTIVDYSAIGTRIDTNTAGSHTGSLLMYTTNAGTLAERMRISPSGSLLINTTTDIASSKLTIESTTQGFLPPRMTTTQKNAISTPAAGLMVYDTTLNLISVYNGTIWISL
jgi:hypothetical protein